MHTRILPRRILSLAALLVAACTTTRYPPVGVAGPADGLPNAVSDDGNPAISMSEGGPSTLPYVVDGEVTEVTAHTVSIRSSELGDRWLTVPTRTPVTLDGRPAHLSQLRPGMPLRAAYSATGVAQALQAGKGAFEDSRAP